MKTNSHIDKIMNVPAENSISKNKNSANAITKEVSFYLVK